MTRQKTLLTAKEMTRTLERLAFEVIERYDEECDLIIIGIERRGVQLGRRLKDILDEKLQCHVAFGKLDINLYRDDWTTSDVQPHVGVSDIPLDIMHKKIVLVDDVLFSGRTIRAALEAILDYGRPLRVELLVLVDRGHRELPIQADYVGKTVQTDPGQHVDVLVKELDGRDCVQLAS